MKIVPGDYFATACGFMGTRSSPINMKINGKDFLTAMEKTSAGIEDLWNGIRKIKFCVAQDESNITDELCQNFIFSKSRFMSIIEDVVSDRDPKYLYEKLLNTELECQLITDYMKDLKCKLVEFVSKYRKKAKLLKVLLEDGIEYLGDSTLDRYLKNNDMNVFILFISEGFDQEKVLSNINYLYRLMNEFPKRSNFLIIDLDVNKVEKLKIPKECVIYHWKNGLLSEDVSGDLAKKSNVGMVYYSKKVETIEQPDKRSALRIRCPGSFGRICSNKLYDWICGKCEKVIEYGFNDILYCECGNYKVTDCRFKCSDYRHYDSVEFRDMNQFYNMTLDLAPIDEINILMIGQSGVGKSTWINGIVNYLTFDSLEEAEKNELIAVVPTQFTICTDDHQTHNISVGEDENEHQKVGASATQECKSYAIVTRDKIIRLIDTPGIGDTRGYEQDAENMIKIIQHIQHVRKLHGICFLLKPNEARLEACFNFCFKELLSFLSKKARSNILFCFTNARSTNYQPGNSLPLIRKIMEDAQTDLWIFKDRVYCFDNESFRFLCAIKDGLKFTDKEKSTYADSWKRSVKETNELISKVYGLEPYDVNLTRNIADLRHKISNVMDSVHEINMNSETATIKSLEGQKTDNDKKLADLNSSKQVQETKLREDPISMGGDIVCTNATCTEMFDGKPFYKQPCCVGWTGSSNFGTLPNADLLQNQILSRQICTSCTAAGFTCRWEQHMIINYKQVKETTTKADETVEDEIEEAKKLQDEIAQKLIVAKEEVKGEEAEKQALTNFASNVFRYLKKDTLVLYNDSVKDYLDYLIKSEESKPDKTGDEKQKIKRLTELKNKFDEESKIAEAVKTEGKDRIPTVRGSVPKITLKHILDEEVLMETYDLRHYKKKPNKYSTTLIHSQKVIRCIK